MLPDGNVRRDTVLAVVEKDDPKHMSDTATSQTYSTRRHSHPIRVHALTDQELVVLEVPDNLLRIPLRTLLELHHLLVTRTPLLHLTLDLLHVPLQMRKVALLVETRLVQAERVHHINDLRLALVQALLGLFSRSIGAGIEALAADADLCAVGFVDGAVDFFEVVGVGDQLVAGDDVLNEPC